MNNPPRRLPMDQDADAIIEAALAWYDRQCSHTTNRLYMACAAYRRLSTRVPEQPTEQPLDYDLQEAEFFP